MSSSSGLVGSFTNGNMTSAGHLGFQSITAERLLRAASVLDLYYTPVLCFLGIVGNCLSVTVFCANGSHHQPSSAFYLSALAISDTGFLLNLFAFWLDGVGKGIILSTSFGCPFVMYTAQVFCFVSVWLTVGFTVERYLAVCSPLKRQSVCTVSKAKKVTAAFTLIALVLFSYVLIIARALPKNEVFPNKARNNRDENRQTEIMSNGDGIMRDAAYEEELAFAGKPIGNHANRELGYPQEQYEYKDDYSSESKVSGGRKDYVEFETYAAVVNYSFPAYGRDDRRNEMESRMTPESFQLNQKHHKRLYGGRRKDFADPLLFPTAERSQQLGEVGETYEPLKVQVEAQGEMKNDALHGEFYTNNNISSSHPAMICTVPQEFLTVSIIANYIDTLITLVIPFSLIAFLNTRITQCILKVKEERKCIVALFNLGDSNGRMNRLSSKSNVSRVPDKIPRNCADSSFSQEQQHRPGRTVTKDSLNWIIKENGSVTTTWEKTVRELHPNISNNSNKARRSVESESPEKSSVTSCRCKQTCACKEYLLQDSQDSVAEPNKRDDSLDKLSEDSGNLTMNEPGNCEINGMVMKVMPKSNTSSPVGIVGKMEKRSSQLSGSQISSEARVTKMLLLVSSVFLLLNLPSYAIRAAAFIQNLLWEDDEEGQRMLLAAQQLSNILLFNTNFAVNFLLYCLSGRKFRESLKRIVFGRMRVNTRNAPVRPTLKNVLLPTHKNKRKFASIRRSTLIRL